MNIPLKFRFIKLFRLKGNYFLNFSCRETSGIVKFKSDNQELWEKKMKIYMKTYEDLFGITKLTEMQEKVIEVQTRLQDVQEKRRKVQEDVFIVQKKLQEMQDILHKTSMGDDMYISVVTQVRELLKEQKRLHDAFSLYDQTEREHQTTLALAINNSQDHESTYREKNKYLSLITGIVGGILGLVGSSINNWRHRKDIKHFATDISDQVVDLKKCIDKLASENTKEYGMLPNASVVQLTETTDMLSIVKSQHDVLQDKIQSLQSVLGNELVSHWTNNIGNISNEHFRNNFYEFERNIELKLKNYAYVNLSLIGSCALFSVLFFFYLARIN